MRTIYLLPLITAVGIALSFSVAEAQLREPLMLPGLVWDISSVAPGHDMMWPVDSPTQQNPTPLLKDFEIGWNWTSLP